MTESVNPSTKPGQAHALASSPPAYKTRYTINGMPASGGHPVAVPDPGGSPPGIVPPGYWSGLAPAGAPFCVTTTIAVEV